MRTGTDCKGIEYQEVPLGKSSDLTGRVYGKLTCLYRVIKTNKSIKNRDSFWLCRCECGNIVVASAHSLNRKDKDETLSCGCYQKQKASEMFKKDEIGNIYGYLTVIGKAPSINGRAYWMCECVCGNKVAVRATSLRSGNTRSCGCLHKEHVYDTFLIDEIGNKYGKLTVVKQVESKVYNDGHSYSQWLCKCDCGREIIAKGSELRCGKVKSCGCMVSKGETKIKEILDKNNIAYLTQYSISDCRSKKDKLLRFDFAIIQNDNSLCCLIEYQGSQHYEKTGWNSPIENDEIKREYCENHNIRLIEVPYWDYKELDWNYLKPLIALKEIISENSEKST